MPRDEHTFTRRSVLRLGVVAAWSVGVVSVVSGRGVVSAQAVQPVGAVAVVAGSAEVEPRYRFDCVTPVPGFAPLGRLEEVWASPGYVTITDCVVSYVGEGAFRLTPEESAVVDVAVAAGAVVTDRPAMYLLILAASTRIDPARLDAKLAELGRPVVSASLALAPQAPQAARFGAWLAANP